MLEALSRAEADLGITDDDDASTGSSDEGQQSGDAAARAATEAEAKPQGEGEGEPGSGEPPARQPSDPTQAELDRINTLVSQGRIGELSARQRGIYNAIAERALADHQLQQTVIDRALELRQMRTDDPEGFLDWREQNPSAAQAYDQFWRDPAHASLTAENRRPQRTEQQIRESVQSEWESVVAETAQAIATDGGLSGDEYGRLTQEHKNLGSLLQASFNAAVNKKVTTTLASERARIEQEATEAARHELEVEYASRNAVRFPGGGVTGSPTPRPQAADSMAAAVDMAEEQLARRQVSSAR